MSNEIFRKYTDPETFEKIVDYKNVTEMWEHSVSTCPDTPAIVDNGKTYTYAMNGHTGKVYGELPISFAKLGILLAAVAVPLTAFLTLLGGMLF